jgi:hypothetical protein
MVPLNAGVLFVRPSEITPPALLLCEMAQLLWLPKTIHPEGGQTPALKSSCSSTCAFSPAHVKSTTKKSKVFFMVCDLFDLGLCIIQQIFMACKYKEKARRSDRLLKIFKKD